MLIVLVPCVTQAKTLSLEIGKGAQLGSYQKNNYSCSALALKVPMNKYDFVEFRIGELNGSEILSAAYGLTYGNKTRIHISLGGAYLGSVPYELSGNMQFIISAGFEHDIGKCVLGIHGRHESNGQKIFGHNRKQNLGIDHVMIGIGVKF